MLNDNSIPKAMEYLSEDALFNEFMLRETADLSQVFEDLGEFLEEKNPFWDLSLDMEEPSPTCSSVSTSDGDLCSGLFLVSPVTCMPVQKVDHSPQNLDFPTDLSMFDNVLKSPTKCSSSYTDEWLNTPALHQGLHLTSSRFSEECAYRPLNNDDLFPNEYTTTPSEISDLYRPADSGSLFLNACSTTPVKSTARCDTLRIIQDDHSYSAPLPLPKLEIKIEIEENEDSIPRRPPSAGSSVPDIETMPLYASDDNMSIKKEPVSKPQAMLKSRGKNMTLLQAEQGKTVTTRKRKGRKPKNSPPAKRANVGRPRTKNPHVGFNAADLEAALRRQSCRKNTRRRKKIANSVETTPETSSPTSVYSDSDNDYFDLRHSDEKRASHNQAERQRRQQLSSLFLNLKSKVPKMGDNKTSKVSILKAAAEFVKFLKQVERQSLLEQAALQKKIKRLRAMTGI